MHNNIANTKLYSIEVHVLYTNLHVTTYVVTWRFVYNILCLTIYIASSKVLILNMKKRVLEMQVVSTNPASAMMHRYIVNVTK